MVLLDVFLDDFENFFNSWIPYVDVCFRSNIAVTRGDQCHRLKLKYAQQPCFCKCHSF
ncbi:hypothetical protein DsansV1_C11g0111861 [Dioscorea sansibarensis]